MNEGMTRTMDDNLEAALGLMAKYDDTDKTTRPVIGPGMLAEIQARATLSIAESLAYMTSPAFAARWNEGRA